MGIIRGFDTVFSAAVEKYVGNVILAGILEINHPHRNPVEPREVKSGREFRTFFLITAGQIAFAVRNASLENWSNSDFDFHIPEIIVLCSIASAIDVPYPTEIHTLVGAGYCRHVACSVIIGHETV